MKQYKNMTKSTIEVLPSSGQTIYTPGRKAIFTLPYASLISLEDIALHFSFTPTGVQNTSTDGYPTLRVLPPKDIASLIEEVDIKINGQTIQHLTRYNDIVNLLNYFDQPQSAKRVLQNADATKSYIKGENGQFVSMDTNYNYDNKTYNEPKAEKYVINHWYGLLGHRGDEVSSNFVDTNMLGEVTIAFTFASAATCFQSPKATGAAIIAGFGLKPVINGSGAVTTPGGTHATGLADGSAIQAEIDTAVAKSTNISYQLTDLKMSMVRYNLPQSYSEALASNLSSGAKYQIAFNHYEIRSQHLGGVDKGTLRWNENSRDIKGLMAFFTNTLRADSTLPSTYDPKVESSAYFNYGNPIHDNSQFQIGSVKMPQNTLDSTDAYLELIRAVPGARGYNRELMYQDDMSVNKWLETYFMAYLSLEMTEGMTTLANGGKKLLSGLSSEQLPISCSYSVVNDTRFKGASTPDKTMNVMTLSTRLLVIENGQNVFVEI